MFDQKYKSTLSINYSVNEYDSFTKEEIIDEGDNLWNNIVNYSLVLFNLPINVATYVKLIINSPKKWNMYIKYVINLCTEISLTNWSITVSCYKNDMLNNSETLLWNSKEHLNKKNNNIIKFLPLDKNTLDIIMIYSLDINEEIVICPCNNDTHTTCCRDRPSVFL